LEKSLKHTKFEITIIGKVKKTFFWEFANQVFWNRGVKIETFNYSREILLKEFYY
jgi:hypothetical protein